MKIHSTAVVASTAVIAEDVQIGPFCVVEDGATIGPRCRLASGVVIKSDTHLGSDNYIEVGAVLGGPPQHLGTGDTTGGIVIGNGNQIREYVTVHRAFQPEGRTQIGDHNMFMAGSHVGHDSVVGNHNVLANNVMLAGHVEMEDRNYIGGGAAFHQFCRVGSFAMVGGLAQVKRDVPPYVMVDGGTGLLVGINVVGLRRAGFSEEDRRRIKVAYRLAFRSNLTMEEKLHALKREHPDGPARNLWQFLEGGSRGILPDRRGVRDSSPAVKVNGPDSEHPASFRRTA